MDWLKEWWPIIVAMLLGAVGFGKMSEENKATKKKVEEIKDQLDEFEGDHPMTLTNCKERQASCHMVQKAYHGSVEKDIEELQASFRAMKQCNDTQHSTIISRVDSQHSEVIRHLIAINGNGK